MALKAVLKSLDGLDESLQELYKTTDEGVFVLDVEGVDEMPAVNGLKRKNAELLSSIQSLKDKVGAYGDVTPEQIAELKEKAARTGKGGPEIEELERKMKQQSEQAQRELEQAQRQIQAAKEEADQHMSAAEDYYLTTEIQRACQQHRGEPELLEPHLRKQTKVERTEDGKFVTKVIGPHNTERIKDSQGNPYTLADLVADAKSHPVLSKAFDTRTGSDAPPGGGGGAGGGSGTTFDRSDPVAWGKNAEAVSKGEAKAV